MKCENCDRQIGKLEAGRKFKGQPVCAACFVTLTSASNSAMVEGAKEGSRQIGGKINEAAGKMSRGRLYAICAVVCLAMIGGAAFYIWHQLSGGIASLRHSAAER